jgi:hypothetical protein
MDRPAIKWCRSQREILQAQIDALDGRAPSPYSDFANPVIFANTPAARGIIGQWIDQIDRILKDEDASRP